MLRTHLQRCARLRASWHRIFCGKGEGACLWAPGFKSTPNDPDRGLRTISSCSHMSVVALWEAFYIENPRFDLDTLGVPMGLPPRFRNPMISDKTFWSVVVDSKWRPLVYPSQLRPKLRLRGYGRRRRCDPLRSLGNFPRASRRCQQGHLQRPSLNRRTRCGSESSTLSRCE